MVSRTRTLRANFREGALLLGFVLLLAAAVVTVVLPELEQKESGEREPPHGELDPNASAEPSN
jgi:hypothetical protein